jgi:molybdenum cofactor cytidylyltransferase
VVARPRCPGGGSPPGRRPRTRPAGEYGSRAGPSPRSPTSGARSRDTPRADTSAARRRIRHRNGGRRSRPATATRRGSGGKLPRRRSGPGTRGCCAGGRGGSHGEATSGGAGRSEPDMQDEAYVVGTRQCPRETGRHESISLRPRIAPLDSIASIVLAAGAGRRFGGRKQLAQLNGRPLVEHALVGAGAAAAEVLLVLGAFGEEIENQVDLSGVTVVHCSGWSAGVGASLRAGLAALRPGLDAALVFLGDVPFPSPAVTGRLLLARSSDRPAVRAVYSGRPGHPVLIEKELFAPLIAALPKRTPASLLREAGVLNIECIDLGEPVDVDEPSQLQALGAKTAPVAPQSTEAGGGPGG